VTVYDISAPIRDGMPGFPGDPSVSLVPVKSIELGDAYSLSAISMSSHTGTHLDPPSHFVPGGAPIDRIDLEAVNGPC
jgi:arylformamidase